MKRTPRIANANDADAMHANTKTNTHYKLNFAMKNKQSGMKFNDTKDEHSGFTHVTIMSKKRAPNLMQSHNLFTSMHSATGSVSFAMSTR